MPITKIFIMFLIENKCYHQFINNYVRAGNKKSLIQYIGETRPENYIMTAFTWNHAEDALPWYKLHMSWWRTVDKQKNNT